MRGMCLHRDIYLVDSALMTSRDVSNGEISGSRKVNGKNHSGRKTSRLSPQHPQQPSGREGWAGLFVDAGHILMNVFSIFPPEPFFPNENEVGIVYKFLILFELNLPPVGFNAGSYLFFLLGPYRQHRGSC